MKVLLNREVYGVDKGKTVVLAKGENDLDTKVAESLVKRGLAVKVEAKTTKK